MMCCATCPLNRSTYGLATVPDRGQEPTREACLCPSPRCPRVASGGASPLHREGRPPLEPVAPLGRDLRRADGASGARASACPRHFPDLTDHSGELFCADCPHRRALDFCRQDAYVLATIAEQDEFALASVHHTLDTLVATRHEEKLCELFRCAPAEVRVDLWERLTACHPHSLHLLNELYEREVLPPLEPGQWPRPLAAYRAAAEGRPLVLFPAPGRRPAPASLSASPWGELAHL